MGRTLTRNRHFRVEYRAPPEPDGICLDRRMVEPQYEPSLFYRKGENGVFIILAGTGVTRGL